MKMRSVFTRHVLVLLSMYLVAGLQFSNGADQSDKSLLDLHGSYLAVRRHTVMVGLSLRFVVERVRSGLDCALTCMRQPRCSSFNIAAAPDANGRYLCQVIMAGLQLKSARLVDSKRFHHFVKVSSCNNNPCLNGGACSLHSPTQVICSCKPTHDGNLCERASWKKVNRDGALCFGSLGNTYGTFRMQMTGYMKAIKLVHLSGYVSCQDSSEVHRSNWGCHNENELNVIITDQHNKTVLPARKYLSDPYTMTYTLPGCSRNSPVLQFPAFNAPMPRVEEGEEFRVWYGEDLMDVFEEDNGGTACVDVYIMY